MEALAAEPWRRGSAMLELLIFIFDVVSTWRFLLSFAAAVAAAAGLLLWMPRGGLATVLAIVIVCGGLYVGALWQRKHERAKNDTKSS
jgi:hypothetical protein